MLRLRKPCQEWQARPKSPTDWSGQKHSESVDPAPQNFTQHSGTFEMPIRCLTETKWSRYISFGTECGPVSCRPVTGQLLHEEILKPEKFPSSYFTRIILGRDDPNDKCGDGFLRIPFYNNNNNNMWAIALFKNKIVGTFSTFFARISQGPEATNLIELR